MKQTHKPFNKKMQRPCFVQEPNSFEFWKIDIKKIKNKILFVAGIRFNILSSIIIIIGTHYFSINS